MYSGLLLTKHSGNWLGAHQKFNKVAYRLLADKVDLTVFPSLDGILHFEGTNGPDGLKVKSSGWHEPSHFYDPLKGKGAVLDEIANHYDQLVKALKQHDRVRAAFEASWLSHAITDGLTPAHHYPYESEIEDLRGGGKVTKTRHKVFIRGATRTQTIRSTWRYLGAKGLISTHLHFELGVAAAVTTWRSRTILDTALFKKAASEGPLNFFKAQAIAVANLKLYERFSKKGWTIGLAKAIRRMLAPAIAETIALTWLLAYREAELDK